MAKNIHDCFIILLTSALFRDNIIDFYSYFGNYSFVCIEETIHCLRIHYDSFESYSVVCPKYEKIMLSFPLIFCWNKHIFLMIIQFLLKNTFPLLFEPVIHWTLLNWFFSFLRDLHTDNPLATSKYTKNIKWGCMGLNDAT